MNNFFHFFELKDNLCPKKNWTTGNSNFTTMKDKPLFGGQKDWNFSQKDWGRGGISDIKGKNDFYLSCIPSSSQSSLPPLFSPFLILFPVFFYLTLLFLIHCPPHPPFLIYFLFFSIWQKAHQESVLLISHSPKESFVIISPPYLNLQIE